MNSLFLALTSLTALADCPPLPPNTTAELSAFEICADRDPNCQEFKDLTGEPKWLRLSTKTDLVIKEAHTVHKDDDSGAASLIKVDEASFCRNRIFTRANIGKTIALVGGGKILVMPHVISEVDRPEIVLSDKYGATYREVAAMCLSVFSKCQVGNVAWINFKEGLSRSWNSLLMKINGKNKSILEDLN